MKAEHNSHSLFYRAPFGALCCCAKTDLKLALDTQEWPKSVSLEYTIDSEHFSKPMHYHSKMLDSYIFQVALTMPQNPCILFYYFKIEYDDHTLYYGNNHSRFGGNGELYKDTPTPYQITVYDKSFKTPDWLKKGVMYQIFVDRFKKSDAYDNKNLRSDIIFRTWGETPYYKKEQFGGEYLANDFFGGSLTGVIEKLDYLADLGITIIYLNPIFEAYSNHKYDTGDYEKIDKMFGDEEIFKKLCQKADTLGIKIILDGVFNHTGSDSKYFNKKGKYNSVGAYQSIDSVYFDWYNFSSYPDKYDCWWGIDTLCSVNENTPSYTNYILTGENSIIKRYLRLGAGGWRLDVADELPSKFLSALRREVKATDKNSAIIGEVWEDASNKVSYGELRKYLCGHQLDSVMNYPLRAALLDYILCNIDAKTFNSRLYSLYENYPKEAFMASMNFLSSHDTERVLTRLANITMPLTKDEQAHFRLDNKQKSLATKRLRLAYTLLMCLPGTPCVFYGDELGTEGFGDPFCRSCFDETKTGNDINLFFKNIISLRKNSSALVFGDFEFVYGSAQVCAFIRISDDDFKLMVVNTHETHDHYAPIELGRFGMHELANHEEYHKSENGRFILHIEPMSIKIYDVKTAYTKEKSNE
ncbi:MAG: glycoside hydrolase family 13 protein [Ruminococcaceae bacterium]|nr:glycoside hydrolase family 13 protein [Oscillospiraceae bacterium]